MVSQYVRFIKRNMELSSFLKISAEVIYTERVNLILYTETPSIFIANSENTTVEKKVV